MKHTISIAIIVSALFISGSIYASGQNNRYTAGVLTGSWLYILDTRTGEIKACEGAKLLQTDECWTLNEVQGK